MSAGARGERVIETEDGEVRVLFTNRALGEAEATLGRSVYVVLNELLNGGRVSDVAVLLRAGMEAARRDAREGGKAVSMGQAYALLDEIGFGEGRDAVIQAVSDVITYARSQDGEEDDSADPN